MRFEDQSEPVGCDDPAHDDLCDCGAEPDRDYEAAMGI